MKLLCNIVNGFIKQPIEQRKIKETNKLIAATTLMNHQTVTAWVCLRPSKSTNVGCTQHITVPTNNFLLNCPLTTRLTYLGK